MMQLDSTRPLLLISATIGTISSANAANCRRPRTSPFDDDRGARVQRFPTEVELPFEV